MVLPQSNKANKAVIHSQRTIAQQTRRRCAGGPPPGSPAGASPVPARSCWRPGGSRADPPAAAGRRWLPAAPQPGPASAAPLPGPAAGLSPVGLRLYPSPCRRYKHGSPPGPKGWPATHPQHLRNLVYIFRRR